MRLSLKLGVLVGFSASVVQAAEIASVNGSKLYDSDLVMTLKSGGYNDGQVRNILSDSQSKIRIREDLIGQELLYQRAKREKLDRTADYRNGIRAFERQYLVNLYLEKNLEGELSDKAALKYFKAHREMFSTDQVHAHHILLPTEKRAKEILKQVKKSGADFQALAVKHSIDPSAKNNRGDLGYFMRDRMVEAFSKPVFLAKKGSIVGPIKTPYGYHIVKVVDTVGGKRLEFADVQMKVRAALRQSLVRKKVDGLRAQAKIIRK